VTFVAYIDAPGIAVHKAQSGIWQLQLLLQLPALPPIQPLEGGHLSFAHGILSLS
jgi:hypothetical protein